MAERKEKIVYMDPRKLVPYENNARVHDTELEFIKNSIQEFGFRNPILVDGDNVIIAGHGRRLAAIDLGLEKVPVIVCEDLTEDQVKALRLVDNRTSDLSGWDFDSLNAELAALKDIGWEMEQFSFEDMASFDDTEDGFGDEEVDYVDGTAPLTHVGEDFKVMVHCDSKEAQEALYERLSDDGYSCQKLG